MDPNIPKSNKINRSNHDCQSISRNPTKVRVRVGINNDRLGGSQFKFLAPSCSVRIVRTVQTFKMKLFECIITKRVRVRCTIIMFTGN